MYINSCLLAFEGVCIKKRNKVLARRAVGLVRQSCNVGATKNNAPFPIMSSASCQSAKGGEHEQKKIVKSFNTCALL